jgi:hypothetical protein
MNLPTKKTDFETQQSAADATDPDTPSVVTDDQYVATHGERLEDTLDLANWQSGHDLDVMYERLRSEVASSVKKEQEMELRIRDHIFPMLRKQRIGIPDSAGVYQARVEQIEDVHAKLLFNGGVEAVDGTVVSHDTLPVTITQIGVCLTSYQAEQGTWVHRIFRKEMQSRGKDPVDEVIDLLEQRSRRSAVDKTSPRDHFSALARRGVMAYAERAVLLQRSQAVWRMGHGSPVPWELMTGSGMKTLAAASLRLCRELVQGHKRFVFVPSTTNQRWLLTIGNALRPLEYAIVKTAQDDLEKTAGGHYRGDEWGDLKHEVDKFADEVGGDIAVGIYKAASTSPCQIFYAHVDHVHEAALICLADSVLQEHRGFPMLIDLADRLCTATFSPESFAASAQLAYTEADAPFKYLAERSTRGR